MCIVEYNVLYNILTTKSYTDLHPQGYMDPGWEPMSQTATRPYLQGFLTIFALVQQNDDNEIKKKIRIYRNQ